MDIIKPLPSALIQAKHVIMAIDYLSKLVKAKPLTVITEAKTSNFIWRNIICRFGIRYTIVIDNNGKYFDNKKYQKLHAKFGIKCYCSSPMLIKANDQVEAINKMIKYHLKT